MPIPAGAAQTSFARCGRVFTPACAAQMCAVMSVRSVQGHIRLCVCWVQCLSACRGCAKTRSPMLLLLQVYLCPATRCFTPADPHPLLQAYLGMGHAGEARARELADAMRSSGVPLEADTYCVMMDAVARSGEPGAEDQVLRLLQQVGAEGQGRKYPD